MPRMVIFEKGKTRDFLRKVILSGLWTISGTLAGWALPEVVGDLDEDGKITVSDLTRLVNHLQGQGFLSPEVAPFADLTLDGVTDGRDLTRMADVILEQATLPSAAPTHIATTLPQQGASEVAVTRETVVYFSLPLAEDTVLDNTHFFALFAGQKLTTRIELSSNRTKATLFYLDPLPGNARVRVVFNSDGITDIFGREMDVDRDGEPGGLFSLDFSTVSLTPLAGTAISGAVYDSAPDELGNNVPLAGVIIEVVGAEETVRTVTAANGQFTLDPAPAGRFFVNIDGRPVTGTYPDGDYYPFIGKAWTTVAGRTDNRVNETGEIFLPLVRSGTLQTVSFTEDTVIAFPQSVVDESPDLEGVEVTVPANSLFNESGVRGGRVGIAPVPPDRIPEPLPEGLDLPLVITVQTDGPANFDRPAPVIFPNRPDPETGERLPPGSKSALWSFNHDSGKWELGGPMTVTADGLYVVTDPGVGIRQPGWHGTRPGTFGSGGGGIPLLPGDDEGDCPDCPPNPDPEPDDGDGDDCKEEALLAFSGMQQANLGVAAGILMQIPDAVGDLAGTPGAGQYVSGKLAMIGATADAFIVGDSNRANEFYNSAMEGTAKGVLADTLAGAAAERLAKTKRFGSAFEAAKKASPIVKGAKVSPAGVFVTIASVYPSAIMAYMSAGERLGDLLACADPLGLNYKAKDEDEEPGLQQRLYRTLELISREVDPAKYPLFAKFGRFINLQIDIINASTDYLTLFWGEEAWLRIPIEEAGQSDRYMQLIAQQYIDDQAIGETEKNLILNDPDRPTNITDQNVEDIVALLNARGGNGLSEEDRQAFLEVILGAESTWQAIAEEVPWDDPFFFWNYYLPALWLELFPPPPDPPPTYSRLSSGDGDGGGGSGDSGATTDISTYLRPEPNEHYYYLQNGNTRFESRGRTNKLGQFDDLILTPKCVVYVHYYNAKKNKMAISIFRTPESGESYRIPVTRFIEIDEAPDADADGIPDVAEFIVGTDENNPDSDGDGVLDGAEVKQDMNPLDNRPMSTGILADVPVEGGIVDLAARDDFLVGVGESGLTVFDVTSPLEPVIAGQDPSGPMQKVALQGDYVAVATGTNLLKIYNISDPAAPELLHPIAMAEGRIQAVAMNDTFVFVALSSGKVSLTGEIVCVDVITGSIVSRVEAETNIADMVADERYVYTLREDTLTSYLRSGQAALVRQGTISDPAFNYSSIKSGHLFLGDGFLLASGLEGFVTVDLSDRANPMMENYYNFDQFGWKQMALNGSGLMIAATSPNASPDGPHDVDIYTIGNTGLNPVYQETITTGDVSRTVLIDNGIAYVGGQQSLKVLSYEAIDTGSTAPSISLSAPLGTEVSKGAYFTVEASATDDVQVREVAFYYNDRLVSSDGNYPFRQTLLPPETAIPGDILSVHAIATDTAGNQTQSETLTFLVVEDAEPPYIVGSVPINGGERTRTDRAGILPNEILDLSSVTAESLYLIYSGLDLTLDDGNDTVLTGDHVDQAESSAAIYLNFDELLEPGRYRIVATPDLADLSGNRMLAGFSAEFSVFGTGQQDSDGDYLPDALERSLGYDPFSPDSNGDGVFDGYLDYDNDDLTNRDELSLGTDITNYDTDADGLFDGPELEFGSDPLDYDTDDDRMRDGIEFSEDADPNNVDTDGDNIDDWTEYWNRNSHGYRVTVPDTPVHHVSSPVIIFLNVEDPSPQNPSAVSEPVSLEAQP